MADKTPLTQGEKKQILKTFSGALNEQSYRIIREFNKQSEKLNGMLETAWSFKDLC